MGTVTYFRIEIGDRPHFHLYKGSRMTDDQAAKNSRLFEDPAIARAAAEDPFAKFVQQHWKRVALVVAVALAIGYGINNFRSTRELKRANVSALFADMRNAYSQLTFQEATLMQSRMELTEATDPTKKAEVEKRIAESETALNEQRVKIERMSEALEDNVEEPFPRLARLYRGLVAARSGDVTKARNALSGDRWESTGTPGSPERFVAELGAFVLGKALVDDPTSIKEGTQILAALAERGDAARLGSALAYAAIAASPEERASAKKFLEAIKTQHPEQSKFVLEAISDLE
jgi:hypothetical protein